MILNEQEIQKIARMGLESHYFFCKVILGFDKLTALHKEISEFICHPDNRKKMVLIPRKHFKSSLITVGYSMWRIAKDPEITILICNERDDNVNEWILKMETHLLSNQLLRACYPYLMPDDFKPKIWKQSAFIVSKTALNQTPTVEGCGVGSAVTSKHRDLIIEDDLISKNAVDCPDTMAKAIEFHQLIESCFEGDIGEGEEIVVGTRWCKNDVYEWIKKKEPDFKIYCREVVENGKPILPEGGFSMEKIKKLKNRLGSFFFSAQYTNNPRDREDIMFQGEWLRKFQLKNSQIIIPEEGVFEKNWERIHLHDLDIILIADPSHSEKEIKKLKFSKSCVTALAADSKMRVFLLDFWAKRGHIQEIVDMIFVKYQKWFPRVACIEEVGFQKYLKTDLEREAKERHLHINIKQVRPRGREDKISRILTLSPYLERGEFFVPEYMDIQPFLDEYEAFPNEHISLDILDTIGYGLTELRPRDYDEDELEDAYNRARLDSMDKITGY